MNNEIIGTSSNSLIQKAWNLRWNQEIESCMLLLPEVKALADQTIGDTRPDVMTEWLLLKGSIHRAHGKMDLCRQHLEEARATLAQYHRPATFRLGFESAIVRLAEGDFLSALEDFTLAKSRASTPVEKASSLVNILICLENLGLSGEKIQGELSAVIGKIKDRTAAPLPGIISQLEAYDLRSKFHQGKIGDLTRSAKERDGTFDQANYFSLWVGSLPYHSSYSRPGSDVLQKILTSSPYFFLKSYRTRTLFGGGGQEDASNVKISEKVERLYLWTWQWITAPQSINGSKIAEIVHDLSVDPSLNQLAADSSLKLRNALGWLGLVDPSSEDLRKRLGLHTMAITSESAFLLLGLEWKLIQWIKALLAGDIFLSTALRFHLEQHPLWASSEFYFKDLLKSLEENQPVKDSPLFALMVTLITQFKANEKSANTRFVIDLETFSLQDDRADRLVVSEAMAYAFHSLFRRGSVTCADLMRASFGISKFDSVIHQGKIFNLVARMREFSGDVIQISVKAGSIHASGDWSAFEFKEPTSLALTLRSRSEWRELREHAVHPVKKISANQKSIVASAICSTQKEFSRSELEEALGVSRCTVIRRINQWIESGKVLRIGNSRNARYRVADGVSFSDLKEEVDQ